MLGGKTGVTGRSLGPEKVEALDLGLCKGSMRMQHGFYY